MAKLIQARCPSCRREMRVDPEREVSTCFSCSTQSFVITATRPLTRELASQHRWIIDTRPRKRVGILALLVLAVAALGVASTIVALRMRAAPPPAQPVVVRRLAPTTVATEPRRVKAALPPQPVSPLARPVSPSGAGTERLEAAAPAEGTLPREIIQRIIRQSYGQLRRCYEKGLVQNPNLKGKVKVRFRIGKNGSVLDATNLQEDFPDPAVESCLLSAFKRLRFPAPRGGEVSVVYPLRFESK